MRSRPYVRLSFQWRVSRSGIRRPWPQLCWWCRYFVGSPRESYKKHRRIKLICRYQQYFTTNQIVDRVVKGYPKKGLIWHFQGSGKSLLMVFAAQKLRMHPKLGNPTVIIVVDRIDLDTQITATFNASDVPNLVGVDSRQELQRLLGQDVRKVLITTIHKFVEAGGKLNERSNVIVMVDEAHRTQEGDLGRKMREALLNAFLFGLTGTPINRADRNTYWAFGADEDTKGYMSRYSFQDSIRDRATLPLHFEAPEVKLKIDKAAIDEAYKLITGNLSEQDRDDLAKRAAKMAVLVKNPERIRAVVNHIVKHYQTKVEPNGFKAQVVVFDRECCVLYKHVMDEMIGPEASLGGCMRCSRLSLPLFCWLALLRLLPAQTSAKVDFAKDVLPILHLNCVTCHSGTQPASGMRLDRRSAVINRRGVVPGSAENSFLFHRIAGADYGMQMPPTGALKPEQIDTIKRWIEQGADWPDALANEKELPPVNAEAAAMVDALHEGDLAKFMKFAAGDSKLLNARGPEGSTPFMYAVLYTNAATLERLLKLGADPNRRNDANATALMWAATEMDKTKVLLRHSADVNARSNDMRTPLMIAARKPGNSAVVKLLLDNGANPNPNPHPSAESSPLLDAATAGDAASGEMLITKGAEVKPVGEMALNMAVAMECSKCLPLLTAGEIDKTDYSLALTDIAITGDVNAVKMMLDHGADVNIVDPLGRTPLMYAAASDNLPLEEVKMLVEHGADVNARDAHKRGADSGWTALYIARQHGDTPIVAFLLKSGAKSNAAPPPQLEPRRDNTIAAPSREIFLSSRRPTLISCRRPPVPAVTTTASPPWRWDPPAAWALRWTRKSPRSKSRGTFSAS